MEKIKKYIVVGLDPVDIPKRISIGDIVCLVNKMDPEVGCASLYRAVKTKKKWTQDKVGLYVSQIKEYKNKEQKRDKKGRFTSNKKIKRIAGAAIFNGTPKEEITGYKKLQEGIVDNIMKSLEADLQSTIKQKETYTKEEVINLMKEAYDRGYKNRDDLRSVLLDILSK